FVRLVARIKEINITGGFNVYPAEVEEAMSDHRDIESIAVVGRPREDGSEDVVACVTLRDGSALDPEGLKEFARERLTRYNVPHSLPLRRTSERPAGQDSPPRSPARPSEDARK